MITELMAEYLNDLRRDLLTVLKDYTEAFGSNNAYQYHPLTDALGRILDAGEAFASGIYDAEILRESSLFAVNVMRECRNEMALRVVQEDRQEFYENVIALLRIWRSRGWIALDDDSAWSLTVAGRSAFKLGSAA